MTTEAAKLKLRSQTRQMTLVDVESSAFLITEKRFDRKAHRIIVARFGHR